MKEYRRSYSTVRAKPNKVPKLQKDLPKLRNPIQLSKKKGVVQKTFFARCHCRIFYYPGWSGEIPLHNPRYTRSIKGTRLLRGHRKLVHRQGRVGDDGGYDAEYKQGCR